FFKLQDPECLSCEAELRFLSDRLVSNVLDRVELAHRHQIVPEVADNDGGVGDRRARLQAKSNSPFERLLLIAVERFKNNARLRVLMLHDPKVRLGSVLHDTTSPVQSVSVHSGSRFS